MRRAAVSNGAQWKITLASLKINITIQRPLACGVPPFGAGLGLTGAFCQTQKAEERRFDCTRFI
jgi:hypothetical protein